jgi:integrase
VRGKQTEAIIAKAKLAEVEQANLRRQLLLEAISNLPQDQRAIFEEAGTMRNLVLGFKGATFARAALIAGGGITESELRGDLPSIIEKASAVAAHAASLDAFDRTVDTAAKTLKALGKTVKVPTAFGLRELVTALAPETVVDRFIAFHGDLALTELTMAHLRDFAIAYAGMPSEIKTTAMRAMDFNALLATAKAKGLPLIVNTTRLQHIYALKGLTALAPTQGFLSVDPWAQFVLIVPKGKHSAKQAKPRLPFTGVQVAAVLEDADNYDSTSIDRWGPYLAAFQGVRIEEAGQVRVGDVFEKHGVWCIKITDEDVSQNVKNGASVRTLPVHQKLIDAGFLDFARSRTEEGFMFTDHPAPGVVPMKLDSKGRTSGSFGKRFSYRLRVTLAITDRRLTFHSFRHRWEDAAESATMYQTHRRDLAGRSKGNDSQAEYGDGPSLLALKASLDLVNPFWVKGEPLASVLLAIEHHPAT